MMALHKDIHGGIIMMYSSKEKMRGIACNHGEVIMLWMKKKSMFEKPTRKWREDIATIYYSILPSCICNFLNNGITLLVFL